MVDHGTYADLNGSGSQDDFTARRGPGRRSALVAGMCCLIVVAATAGAIVGGKLQRKKSVPLPTVASLDGLRDTPFLLKPRSRSTPWRAVEVSWQQELTRLPKETVLRPSLCLHLLRIFGEDARVVMDGEPSPVPLLLLLTDEELSRKHFGASTVARTKYGIRFPTASASIRIGLPGDEAHRDQCLACFGEFGVPLSKRIHIGGKASPLREALCDSLANFHLQQDEIEWTALAYALYLPPVKEWRNRYGRAYCFDDLAKELLRRGLRKGSCGGTHRLVTATVLARVDAEQPILSGTVRTEVRAWVGQLVDLVVRSQDPDGSWSVHWYRALAPPPDMMEASAVDTPSSRLLITGHLAEWMSYLPREWKIPDPVRQKAVAWLRQQLKSIDARHFWAEVCPYTHAICAVRDL